MAATEPGAPSPTEGQDVPSGDEPVTADLAERGPRVSTRTLVAIALALVVLLVVSLVVGFAILHQPHLSPVPVPSVPSIS